METQASFGRKESAARAGWGLRGGNDVIAEESPCLSRPSFSHPPAPTPSSAVLHQEPSRFFPCCSSRPPVGLRGRKWVSSASWEPLPRYPAERTTLQVAAVQIEMHLQYTCVRMCVRRILPMAWASALSLLQSVAVSMSRYAGRSCGHNGRRALKDTFPLPEPSQTKPCVQPRAACSAPALNGRVSAAPEAK